MLCRSLCTCYGNRITCRNWLAPSATWVAEVESGSSGLATSAFTCRDSLQASTYPRVCPPAPHRSGFPMNVVDCVSPGCGGQGGVCTALLYPFRTGIAQGSNAGNGARGSGAASGQVLGCRPQHGEERHTCLTRFSTCQSAQRGTGHAPGKH